MTKYRSRPVEVEAMQWSGSEFDRTYPGGDAAHDIVAWVKANGGEARYEPPSGHGNPNFPARIAVRTINGWAYASPGHYIVMGEARFNGGTEGCGHRLLRDFYPCDPETFQSRWVNA